MLLWSENMGECNNKILIVISGNLFVRNYILTDAFYKLEEKHDCHYLVNKNTTMVNEIIDKKGFKEFYEIAKKTQKIHQQIFNTLMWRSRGKSSAFRFRINYSTHSLMSLKRILNGPKSRIHLRLARWLVIKPYILMKRMLLDVDKIYQWYFTRITSKIQPNSILRSYIESNKYDLVIFPSSAYDVEGIDIAWICEENNTNSLFLIDNWDNLCTKTIMWKKPNYLGVWGEQSRQFAVDLHGFRKKNITLLGTPRFNHYFKDRELNINNYFDHKYILFVGTGLYIDEEELLLTIDNIVEKHKKKWGNIKVIYRPHPWRQTKCQVKSSYGVNIFTDPQILAINKDKRRNFQPDLEYYSGLLKNAEYVMGGLTTMLMEGLIFGKQFLAFIHDDDKNVNMADVWKSFDHFKNLDLLDAITLSHSELDIEQKMIECWNKKETLPYSEVDQQISWYLFNDEHDYQDRLLSCVDKLI